MQLHGILIFNNALYLLQKVELETIVNPIKAVSMSKKAFSKTLALRWTPHLEIIDKTTDHRYQTPTLLLKMKTTLPLPPPNTTPPNSHEDCRNLETFSWWKSPIKQPPPKSHSSPNASTTSSPIFTSPIILPTPRYFYFFFFFSLFFFLKLSLIYSPYIHAFVFFVC